MVVNKFLLGHQYLDFKRVPEFFKLFYSSDLEVSQGPENVYVFISTWYGPLSQSSLMLLSVTKCHSSGSVFCQSWLHLCFLVSRGEGDLSSLLFDCVVLVILSTVRDRMTAPALCVCACVWLWCTTDGLPVYFSLLSQHKVEREWMLSVLEEGVADRHCYELCDQQGLYHTLLGFSSSPLCDDSTQVQYTH